MSFISNREDITMPFDGLTLRTSLADALVQMGIQPIDQAVLDAHMHAQRQRHPGSWAYVHRAGLREAVFQLAKLSLVGFVASFGIGMMTVSMGNLQYMTWAIISMAVFVISFFGLGHATTMIKLRKPAQWRIEQKPFSTYHHLKMPASVRALMDRLDANRQYMVPFGLVYGELRRETELLDPYIGVRDATDKVYILAIWDGNTVLHIAA
jgi:hypothetical protein